LEAVTTIFKSSNLPIISLVGDLQTYSHLPSIWSPMWSATHYSRMYNAGIVSTIS